MSELLNGLLFLARAWIIVGKYFEMFYLFFCQRFFRIAFDVIAMELIDLNDGHTI